MIPDAPDGLVLEEIWIGLNGRVLIDFSATVAPGAVLTVMGPSGSGKSALLALIGGFIDPVFSTAGRIVLNRVDITHLPAYRRRAGLLFQDDLLFPHLSVGGNLLFALPPNGAPKAERRRRAEDMLAEVEMADCFDRDPATLSGGQRARVALARVLIAAPSALLLDEPFSRLDAPLREQMRALVFAEAAKRKLPVVLVTHEPDDAAAAGGEVVTL
jgi:putative thiamine transport system ATP-binding protein